MKQFQEQFDELLEYWPDEDSSLRDLRLKAFNKFKELGLPNKKWEEWQFTDFSSINKLNFRLSKDSDLPTLPKTIPGRISNSYIIFIVNGHYQPQLSEIPSSVSIATGLEHFRSNPELYSINNSSNPFLSLNTSMMNSGLPIYIKDNAIIEKPIQVVYLTTKISDELMNHPRFSFNAGENSESTIIEQYIGSTSNSYFINAVTQVNIEKNAKLNHVRIQEDDQMSHHTACTYYTLNKSSILNSTSISSGSQLYRHNIKLSLNDESADATLNGLSLTKDSQHHDQHVIVDHNSDACHSNQLFKYILSDKSSGVFNG
ncbi:MAG: SufD family Fe-S cluster assembly protein, partial [Candidatus Marinimicrobia bacterium]|nr:SufD family Fe-S cluster assembly protein [Candidatus Neomarinimicrobiota bacterium]